ncbi:hypothetical protein [Kineococcus arenarius]|uniref:hypothetical protein n=1 Tax=unclassified Kineococcus TaxID=2621656 RepID=UPI003D7E3B49
MTTQLPFHTPRLSTERETLIRQWLQTEAAASLRGSVPASGSGGAAAPVLPRRAARRAGRLPVRRLALGLAVAGAVAGVVVLGPGEPGTPAGPAVAAAGVTFSADGGGGALLAEITDPEASAAAMTAAFAQRGLDIRVTLVPAAPELVGTVVMTASDPALGSIEAVAPRAGCVTAGGAPCATAVQVSAGFSGVGEVSIGRAPHAGEQIVSS